MRKDGSVIAVSCATHALECGGLTPLSTIADLTMLRQLNKLPTNFSIRYFKPGDAWRRAAIGAGYATGIEKQNSTASFVTRDVRVPMYENIYIVRWSIRRSVLQTEFQPVSHKINDKRPLEIAVAISTHYTHARSDRPQFVKNRFGANIAKMPDFMSVCGHLPHVPRQTIVRIGENKDTQGVFGLFLHVCTRNLNAPL